MASLPGTTSRPWTDLGVTRWSEIALGKVAIGVIALFVGVLIAGLTLPALLWLVCLFCALGIFGYALNDWCDRSVDAVAGKRNSFTGISSVQAAAFFALIASLILLLALFAPAVAARGLIVLQLALAFAYSHAPLRLKARGAWGLIGVILAQYLVPSWIILRSVPGAVGSDWMYLNAFALVHGLVLESGHQRWDREHDRAAGVATFGATWPVSAVTALYRWCVPVLGLLIALCPAYIAWRMVQSQGLSGAALAELPLAGLTVLHAGRAFADWRRDPTLDPFYGESSRALWRLYSYLPNCFIPLYLAVLIAVSAERGWVVLAATLVWLRCLNLGSPSYSTRLPHYGFRWHAVQIASVLLLRR